ncbi:GNAT family N-acetyltransferase [Polymorphospora lycopeni]|uniref:GNAT family N-acetyltransferase n=1 Tax=Polymorphospora lycopeni TaxID=3140240 RepID=A0ABV5D249_9ACTN
MNSDPGQKRPGIPPLALRQFREGDFDELAALNAYGLAAAGIKAADDYYSDQDFQDLQNTYAEPAGGTLLVGEINDKIVAMGGIRRTSPSSCELLRMRVYPQYQGQGYGTLILESLKPRQDSSPIGGSPSSPAETSTQRSISTRTTATGPSRRSPYSGSPVSTWPKSCNHG